LASALGARILDHRARALAYRAGPRHAEEALLIAHLSVAVALLALARSLAPGRTRAVASVARLAAADGDFLFYAERRVLKRNRKVFANVRAGLCARASSASPTSAKQIAEAEHLSEQVADVHLLESALSAASAAVGEGVMPEAVVCGPLLLIAQHRVSLAALLEALF